MKQNHVTVLDLGSTKATCLAASLNDAGDLKVRAVASIPCKGMRRGVITDLDEAGRSIDASVKKVQQELGEEISSLIVTIAGSHLEGTNAQGFKPIVPRGRHITGQDILEVVNHSRHVMLPPDREQIQAIPREFRVNGVRDVRKPVGMAGEKLEVVTYIVTGQTSALQNLDQAVTMGGRTIDQMILSPLASGIGVLTEEEMEIGTAVLDIGAGSSNIAIFTNGSMVHCAHLPIGSWHISNDLSKLLKTSPDEAERLKVQHGSATPSQVSERESVEVHQLGQPVARPLQRRVLSEIIEARVRELAVMAHQQLDKSGLFPVLTGGLVLTGGGSQLAGIEKLFEDVMKNVRVRSAGPDLPAPYSGDRGLSVAVGAARFALQCYEEITPAQGGSGWKDRVRSLFSFGAP